MVISDISSVDVALFLRLEEGEYNEAGMQAVMAAARQYIVSYTGLPETAEEGETIDSYEDLTFAYLVICRELWDNRTMDVQTVGAGRLQANKVIDSILSMHARNLV